MEELDALVADARSGDLNAFGTLVRRFQDMAVGYAYAILGDFHRAEDATQEAFIEAYLRLANLREPSAFAGWLRRIVMKHCDRILRRSRVSTVSLESAECVVAETLSPSDAVERSELRDFVMDAIHRLPESQRTVTTLFYINGYSQSEIGAFLEIPSKTVKSRLHSARNRLKEGMLQMVQDNLTEQRPSKDERFTEQVTAILEAVGAGDLQAAMSLLKAEPGLLRATGGLWKHPLLHHAAEHGHVEVAKFLLANGANISERDQGDNATALHWAAENKHLEVVKFLVEQGADVNAVDDVHERGPVGWATALSSFHREIAEYLVSQGAKLDIFAAVALEDAAAVRRLVGESPHVLHMRMSRFEQCQKPIHFAVTRKLPRMVELFLQLGADIQAVTDEGKTPLCLAAEAEDSEMVDFLLGKGATMDFRAALTLGRTERARELLDAGLSFEELSWGIASASRYGHTDIVKALLERRVSVHGQSSAGWMRGATPLHHAASGGHVETARLLLEHGADVNAMTLEFCGMTPLHCAAEQGHLETAKTLVEHGADIARRDRLHNGTPSGWAHHCGHPAVSDYLKSLEKESA